jgi:NADPH:quinone reductase
VGDKFAEPAFRSIGWNGRYLVVGFAGGEIPKLPLNLALIKGASIVGVFWGAFTMREPKVHAANMAELIQWLGEGKLHPHISRRFSLDDGAEAIRWMMDRKAMGKVLIEA